MPKRTALALCAPAIHRSRCCVADIGAMRDRLILVRGCSSGTGRLPIKSFNRGLAPLKLDVASGVPDIRVAYRGSADTR